MGWTGGKVGVGAGVLATVSRWLFLNVTSAAFFCLLLLLLLL